MANGVFKKGIQGLLGGLIDLDTDDMRVRLVRGYTPNLNTHEFMTAVTGGGGTIVSTSGALTGVTLTDGVFDAADPTFTSVGAGAACQHLIYYKHTGVDATSRLLLSIDSATGLPVTPDGGNILVTHDNGANRIVNFAA